MFAIGHTTGSLPDNTNAGLSDFWVARYSGADGNRIWLAQFGTTSDDYGVGIAVDHNGDVFVAGITLGSLYATHSGLNDCYVAKLSGGNGKTVLWGVQYGTTAGDTCLAVAVDSNGDVYAGGETGGSLYDSNFGGSDSFVSKHSGLDGSLIWGKQFGASSTDRTNSLAIGSGDDVFTGGRSQSSLFGTNAGGWDNVITHISFSPTGEPSGQPTAQPSQTPTKVPSTSPPTPDPSSEPSGHPTAQPSRSPTEVPSTSLPTSNPSSEPSGQPTALLSRPPTEVPSTSPPTSDAPTPDTTAEGLCALASSFNFSHRDIVGWRCDLNGTFNDSVSICEDAWDGIVCEEKNGDTVVTQINVSNYGIIGVLPEDIGKLAHLEVLDVSENFLLGPLPSSFGALQRLVEMRLQGNYLGVVVTNSVSSGDISIVETSLFPVFNLSSLEILDISANNFTGPLPDSMCTIDTMTQLHASSNDFDCVAPCLLNSNSLTLNLEEPVPSCDVDEADAICASRVSGHIIGVVLLGIFLAVGYHLVRGMLVDIPHYVWSYVFLWRTVSDEFDCLFIRSGSRPGHLCCWVCSKWCSDTLLHVHVSQLFGIPSDCFQEWTFTGAVVVCSGRRNVL